MSPEPLPLSLPLPLIQSLTLCLWGQFIAPGKHAWLDVRLRSRAELWHLAGLRRPLKAPPCKHKRGQGLGELLSWLGSLPRPCPHHAWFLGAAAPPRGSRSPDTAGAVCTLSPPVSEGATSPGDRTPSSRVRQCSGEATSPAPTAHCSVSSPPPCLAGSAQYWGPSLLSAGPRMLVTVSAVL